MFIEKAEESTSAVAVKKSMLAAIGSGVLLNPLNSSMISVALVTIAAYFSVSIPTVTWLVSGFYLAAAIGQPLMGRLADLFGPRKVFLTGMIFILAGGALGPFAPSIGVLIAIRALQAFGTSTAYPSGLAVIRRVTGNQSRPPAAALGVLSIAANVSAALGPTIGGSILAFSDWKGIFAINIPVALIAFVLALRLLPPDPPRITQRALSSENGTTREQDSARPSTEIRRRRTSFDVVGILLFAGTLSTLLVFLLSLSSHIRWLYLPLALLLGGGFFGWERRTSDPFIDMTMLRPGIGLSRVYLTFASMNTVFYSLFFGLPLWLEQAHHFTPSVVGLLMLPFAGFGVLATPVAARLIRVRSVRLVILIGMSTMAGGTLLLLPLNGDSPVIAILAITVLLGIPNSFNNLGLQAALFQSAPADRIGAASGLFQTSRYVGTFMSSALFGIVFGQSATTHGLHLLAAVLAAISILLLLASVGSLRRR